MLKYLPELYAGYPQILLYLSVFLLGVCVGSLSETLAVKMTTEAEPPTSICPHCGARYRRFSVTPEILRLKTAAECVTCGASRPLRRLSAELCAAVFCLIFLRRFGLSAAFFFSVAALGFWMLHSLTDMKNGYIYDSAVAAMVTAGLLMRLKGGVPALMDGAAGAATGFSLVAAVVFLARGAMGTGDATLMLGTGALLGWRLTLLTLYFGAVIGGLFVIVMLLRKKLLPDDAMPFAPFIAAGGLTSILAGEFIYDFFGLALTWP